MTTETMITKESTEEEVYIALGFTHADRVRVSFVEDDLGDYRWSQSADKRGIQLAGGGLIRRAMFKDGRIALDVLKLKAEEIRQAVAAENEKRTAAERKVNDERQEYASLIDQLGPDGRRLAELQRKYPGWQK